MIEGDTSCAAQAPELGPGHARDFLQESNIPCSRFKESDLILERKAVDVPVDHSEGNESTLEDHRDSQTLLHTARVQVLDRGPSVLSDRFE